jgi:hypothetical protein
MNKRLEERLKTVNMIEYLYRDDPLLQEVSPRLYRTAHQVATASSHRRLACIQGVSVASFFLVRIVVWDC